MCKSKHYELKATIFDKKGRVVSIGKNSYIKTHPFQSKLAEKVGLPYKEYLHAEVLAVIRARGRGHSIHIERYGEKGEPRNAKPCPICERAIKEAGLKEISYTIG